MDKNFNLPPGCSMRDVDPPEETEDERLSRQLDAEDAAYDRWRDEQIEKGTERE